MTVLPLDGIRVLDLSAPVGTYCTRLLADLGADVVLVEPPGGDPYRRMGPYRDGDSGPEASLSFGYYNANKRSVTLDLGVEADRRVLERLGESADVIVISPDGASGGLWGFDAEAGTLAWAAPDSIVCAVTPFGVTGPYYQRAVTHLTSFAQGGQMWRIGEPGTPPRSIPANLQWHLAAAHGAIAIVAALGVRDDVGGQFIDISAQEVDAFHDLQFEAYHSQGLLPGGRNIGIGVPPSGMWQCRDGVLDIAAHADRHWFSFLEMMDHPEALTEPAFQDMALRRQIFDGMIDLIEPLLADKSRHELLEKGQQAGLPVCILNTPSQFVDDIQLEHRDFWVDLGRPETGPLRAPGPPARTTPALFMATRPAPLLGEHDHELRTESRPPLRLQPTNRPVRGVLDGVRVVSLGAFVAGNTTAQILAGLGAEVVKIEARSHPEVLRNATYNTAPHLAREPSGVTNTPMYASLARGAKGVAIEMDTPQGRDVFGQLVASCDIVIENFGATVMNKWGCTYEELTTINPRLIMASLSGYGRTGPRSDYLAYGSNIANFTGLSEAWWPSGTYTDFVTAVHATLAILAARPHVARTNHSVYIDTAQIEALAAMAASLYLDPLVNNTPTPPQINHSEHSLLTHVSPCVGEDRWVAIEVVTPAHWNAICETVERPDLAISTGTGTGSSNELKAAIDAWTTPRTPDTVAHVLNLAGIPAAAVADGEEVYNDPQLHHRHFPQYFNHPDLGPQANPGSPHRLSKVPGHYHQLGPRLGEHTRQVLSTWTDLDAQAIDQLADSGVVFDAGTQPTTS